MPPVALSSPTAPGGLAGLRIAELAAGLAAPGVELALERDGRLLRVAVRPGRWRGTLILRVARGDSAPH